MYSNRIPSFHPPENLRSKMRISQESNLSDNMRPNPHIPFIPLS
jgi:hypothetical protein